MFRMAGSAVSAATAEPASATADCIDEFAGLSQGHMGNREPFFVASSNSTNTQMATLI